MRIFQSEILQFRPSFCRTCKFSFSYLEIFAWHILYCSFCFQLTLSLTIKSIGSSLAIVLGFGFCWPLTWSQCLLGLWLNGPLLYLVNKIIVWSYWSCGSLCGHWAILSQLTMFLEKIKRVRHKRSPPQEKDASTLKVGPAVSGINNLTSRKSGFFFRKGSYFIPIS